MFVSHFRKVATLMFLLFYAEAATRGVLKKVLLKEILKKTLLQNTFFTEYAFIHIIENWLAIFQHYA